MAQAKIIDIARPKKKVRKVSRIPTELLRGKDGKDAEPYDAGARDIETKREGNLLFIRVTGGEWGEPINLEAEVMNSLGGGVDAYPRVDGSALYDQVQKLQAQLQLLKIEVGGDAVQYATRYDVVDSTTSYLGEAAVGSLEDAVAWRIKRITTAVDGDISISYADGVETFDKVWDDRATYTYN